MTIRVEVHNKEEPDSNRWLVATTRDFGKGETIINPGSYVTFYIHNEVQLKVKEVFSDYFEGLIQLDK